MAKTPGKQTGKTGAQTQGGGITPQQQSPMLVQIVGQTDFNTLELIDLLQVFLANPKGPARAATLRRLPNLAKLNDDIHVAGTLTMQDVIEQHQIPVPTQWRVKTDKGIEIATVIPTSTWGQKDEVANPYDGTLLIAGNFSPDQSQDWSNVSHEGRLLGYLMYHEDRFAAVRVDVYTAIEDLQKSTLPGRWVLIKAHLDTLGPAAKAALEEHLVYKRKDTPGSGDKSQTTTTASVGAQAQQFATSDREFFLDLLRLAEEAVITNCYRLDDFIAENVKRFTPELFLNENLEWEKMPFGALLDIRALCTEKCFTPEVVLHLQSFVTSQAKLQVLPLFAKIDGGNRLFQALKGAQIVWPPRIVGDRTQVMVDQHFIELHERGFNARKKAGLNY